MTMRELAEYRWLRREIHELEHRLAVLETSTLSPAAPKLSGSSRSRGGDRMAEYVIRSDDLRRILRQRRKQAETELLRLESFIASVPDSLDRQILTRRFVEGYSWTRTAHAMGGGNTPEGVRSRAYRCLRMMQDPPGGV